MPHTLNPLLVRTGSLWRAAGSVFSGNLQRFLLSVWLHDPTYTNTPPSQHHTFSVDFEDANIDPARWFGLGAGVDNFNNFVIAVFGHSPSESCFQRAFNAPSAWPSCTTNMLISCDITTGAAQIYLNDVPMALEPLSNIGPTAAVSAGVPFASSVTVQEGMLHGDTYVSDLWFSQTGSYIDLTVTANRRKFINADHTPVDLGPTGALPFGTPPTIFQMLPAGAAETAFLTNRGSIGGTLTHDTLIMTVGDPCVDTGPPPEEATLTDAELFFAPTGSFVDMSAEANRRKFVATGGTPAWMGPHGALPFADTPPVYLSTLGPPLDFAGNNGSGGGFAPTPPVAPAGGPGCTPYYITEAAGPAADPQWRLTVSDDGGRTWGRLVKPRSAGALGEYLSRLRWLKMGQSRERMVKLECTDPVRRNIVGVYIDAGQGMG